MGARLILRPLSVQERIRELNLRARHFAETVLAVQVSKHFGCFLGFLHEIRTTDFLAYSDTVNSDTPLTVTVLTVSNWPFMYKKDVVTVTPRLQ